MDSYRKNYQSPDIKLWQGRSDSLAHERFFQRVLALDLFEEGDLKEGSFALLGFMSDEGIRLNGGRVGAARGPSAIRSELGRLACHWPTTEFFYDAGNILCHPQQLEVAQQALARAVAKLLRQNLRPILLGGGHEIAWGHYLGLVESVDDLAVINFDAHYDLRSVDAGSNSGNSFSLAAQYALRKNQKFDYLVVGLQESANTASLCQTASAVKAAHISADEINSDLKSAIKQIQKFAYKRRVYLSICLDVLAYSYAPGVSAPQAFGLSPHQLWQLIRPLLGRGQVVSLDIAELSPPHDHANMTSKLCAELLSRIMHIGT